MSRFLMALWEGGGTLPPELGVARRLMARGHEVHVLADPTVEDDAAAAGCAFTPWRRAPRRTSLDPAQDLLRDWEVRDPITMLRRVRDVFVAGPAAAYAADTLDAIRALEPDALLPDFMLFGAIVAGQAAGLPVAPLVPNVWTIPIAGAPVVGPGFRPARTALGRARDAIALAIGTRLFAAGLPALNAVRAAHGLPPLAGFFDQLLGADRILVLTSPTFDFSAPATPPNARYVGPVLDDPPWVERWTPPWPEDDRRPLVLVGLSSTFQDQAPLLRRIVEALRELPVRGVVTLGQMLAEGEVQGTADVAVVRSAPHAAILPRASLVVTHGGHGTTMKALAAGVPVVCLPMGRDQHDTAARVVHLGAGVRLSARAPVRRIRRAIRRALDEPRFRARAARVAAALASEARAVDVVAELEALVAGRRSAEGAPVRRRGGPG